MNLNGEWGLYYYDNLELTIDNPEQLIENKSVKKIAAKVPGNVELDLSRAGVLPEDMYFAENIKLAEKYETYDWWYETTFTPTKPQDEQTVLLHFGAVDCFADYYLNGKKFATSRNMFIEQEFDVTTLLNYEEENTLHVHIHSPLKEANKIEKEPQMLGLSWHETAVSQVVRKAPHSFGWDIMPRALSAGIWRDVSLKYRNKYYFKNVYFYLHSIEEHKALGGLLYEAELGLEYAFKPLKLTLDAECGDHKVHSVSNIICAAGKIHFDVRKDKLWWPKNYGEQNIYDIKITISTPEGEELLSENFRYGFRFAKLIRTDLADKENGRFEFNINGKKVMAIGTNWVPMDVYHSRDKERYQKAIELADDIGCNIIRCWGGNVYEDHEFFNLCDERGIMVWQDFAMACHFYPQSEYFKELIEEEATSVIKKLRNHPSLVLWCGDNEVDSMMYVQENPKVNYITREVLPRLVERFDYKRPYIASSPYISEKAYELGCDYFPEDHLWGVRDYYKSDFYVRSNAHFVSETGYHGCPSEDSIRKFISEDHVWPYTDNSEWNLHSTDQANSPDRVMLMHNQVMQIFGEVPDNISDYTLASQISQAEAKKFFIERVRRRQEDMGGIIWWNLLDGWPQMSDAVVDYYYSKKLAYSYIKRSSYPVITFVGEMDPNGHSIFTSNNTFNDAEVKCKITDIESGRVVFEREVVAPANTVNKIGFMNIKYSEKGMFLIEYTVNGKKQVNTYLYGYPAYDFDSYKKWLKVVENAEK